MTEKGVITVALAGNANVGKSVIFNQLTGLHQHVGNWPGKTVERAEGTLAFKGYEIDILDLPGIYSLSTYSIEEVVSREYIAVEQPDVIVNVLDATALERNLFFTIQLLELEPRMILALNQIDIAEKKGISIDTTELGRALGTPVVPTVAITGRGLENLMRRVVQARETHAPPPKPLEYGEEVERGIREIATRIEVETPYPKRWVAIKLLEGDEEIEELIYMKLPELQEQVQEIGHRFEEIHGHDAPSVIASERYALAHKIADQVTDIVTPQTLLRDKLMEITSHPVSGYIFMLVSILAIFYSIFTFGDILAGILEGFFSLLEGVYFNNFGSTPITDFIWRGIIDGFVAGVAIALPYIAPFYLLLSLLEDSGYLARVAFLMDSAMHQIGLHGKAFIPLILGFGCNVPAILGCKIMETEREQLICAFVASLVPCAARNIVIFGLVATYLGFQWALLLYIIDFIIIFALGRIAFKTLPGEAMGLIMEMPEYRIPQPKVTAQRTWLRLKGFIYEAFPIMVLGNLAIYIADIMGIIDVFQNILKPVTVTWLGLPAAAGVVLIFGILRKELTLILLASMMGTTNFSAILTPLQMFVFAFVVMIYVPCISTIAVLIKDFGYKNATMISLLEVLLAVILGGILYRVLPILPTF
jgi:ferrous iron transport protein B